MEDDQAVTWVPPGGAAASPQGAFGGPWMACMPGPQGMDAEQMQAMMSGYQQMMQQQAMMASQFAMHAAQAFESNAASQAPDAEVTELAHHFKLDERITRDLGQQLKKRGATFEDDMKALWEILEGARNPAGLLRVKIREMEEGSFRGSSTPDRDVQALAGKYGLDAQAAAKLAEVLNKRGDRRRDLRQIGKHLELSNKPSSLIMLMLKDLRAGLPVRDPEYPAAVGSYAHKRGLKRSRSRSRKKKQQRRESSSSPSRGRRSRSRGRPSGGAGPIPGQVSTQGEPRAQTLLERFG